MMSSPLVASISLPSSVMVTSSSLVAIRTGPVFDVDEELVAEHADGRHDGARNRRPERADRRLPRRPRQARRDVVTDIEQEIEVGVTTLTLLDAAQDLLEPSTPLPARGALST